jgi:ketosteroid isomerase-like protein
MRGDMSLDQKSVIVYEMLDSRVTRAEQYYDDTTYNDRFWA